MVNHPRCARLLITIGLDQLNPAFRYFIFDDDWDWDISNSRYNNFFSHRTCEAYIFICYWILLLGKTLINTSSSMYFVCAIFRLKISILYLSINVGNNRNLNLIEYSQHRNMQECSHCMTHTIYCGLQCG